MPVPTRKTPINIINRGPHLSTRNPIMGANSPDSRERREKAPDVRALLHPNSVSIGRKNTLNPSPKTTVMYAFITTLAATIYQP